jgi:hypothetical protein
MIRPEIVQRYGQTADVNDILAFAADRLRKCFEMGLAKGLVLNELNVPVGVLLAPAPLITVRRVRSRISFPPVVGRSFLSPRLRCLKVDRPLLFTMM